MSAGLTADFDYVLPAERIAQEPRAQRDAARLLHVLPGGGFADHVFSELPLLLRPGDLLVANHVRVRRARLRATTADGHAVELLVLARQREGVYSMLTRPARRAAPGTTLTVSPRLLATVVALLDGHPGARVVHLRDIRGDVEAAIAESGTAPLPPYIHRALPDPDRYQTLYATGAPSAAAAPTAGLHVTPDVLAGLRDRGVAWATLRLDVGLGTFAPITAGSVDAHVMHRERFALGSRTALAINAARANGGRVIAVGTTVARVLETCAGDSGTVRPTRGTTGLFIKPGHRFRGIDGLLTNFHQPRSSLLVLLAAFVGGDAWRRAYGHALDAGYRFLSFGDCMLCWRAG